MLVYQKFPKALRSLETCAFVNNDFCGKLVSPYLTKDLLEYHFTKVIWGPLFIPNFDSLSSKLKKFTLKVIFSKYAHISVIS